MSVPEEENKHLDHLLRGWQQNASCENKSPIGSCHFVKQEVDTHERLILSDRDRDRFVSVMKNPPRFKSSLKLAIQKYLKKYDR
ncbi:MAG: hypothetical protein HC763_17400 [Hydrococcus sp. CRU_1_1]|nr:hypothetical protein [Hydrococcus sp. CRU_1_1]